ncbi:hypothetical protein [Microbacterium flavescens]|uniref:hypothetical protein n=1 Tax=Microbacterium flavescens TaxID=69366 RepID=UPI001BDF2275|nr:hypothetical protein [Microbacterium flavescens]
MIIDTSDGPIVVYAMKTDLARSQAVADGSPRPVYAEHRAVMRSADDGPAATEIVGPSEISEAG